MFDKHNTERLEAWKEFRNGLEESNTPFEDTVEFWSRAPFVSSYLNPFDSPSWPDPWHLILDNRLDEFAITLGIMYTLKLTERFKDAEYQIYKAAVPGDKSPRYPLVVNNQVLNFEYNKVVGLEELEKATLNIVWPR